MPPNMHGILPNTNISFLQCDRAGRPHHQVWMPGPGKHTIEACDTQRYISVLESSIIINGIEYDADTARPFVLNAGDHFEFTAKDGATIYCSFVYTMPKAQVA